MICQQCREQPARVQYTELVGGTKKVEWLCVRCARERGISIQMGAAEPAQLPQSLVSEPLSSQDADLRCERCGLSLEAFRESGRVGCPECYEVFRETLDSLLRRVHHATEHTLGEGGQDARSRLQRVLDTLRRELLEAVRHEEFERAASIRDEIRRYEEERAQLEAAAQTEDSMESGRENES